MRGVVNILDHHQPDEIGAAGLIVEGEADKLRQRLQRRQMVEVELGFDLADTAIGILEHRQIEPSLLSK